MLEHPNPVVLRRAVIVVPRVFHDYSEESGREESDKALTRIITDRTIRSDIRYKAIRKLFGMTGKGSLLALADTLDDETPPPGKEADPLFDPTFPFYDHIFLTAFRKVAEESYEKMDQDPPTLAKEAERRLKELTGQDFGRDAGAWREWIETGGTRSFGL